jgi:hypothetical protein
MSDYDLKTAISWSDLAAHYRDDKRIAFMVVGHTLVLGRTHPQAASQFQIHDNEVTSAGVFSSSGIDFTTAGRLSHVPVPFGSERNAVRDAVEQCKLNFRRVGQ